MKKAKVVLGTIGVLFGLLSCKKIPSVSSVIPPIAKEPIPKSMVFSTHWIKANFHAHGNSDLIDNDGTETPMQLHQALQKQGIDFSAHTIHSSRNMQSKRAQKAFRLQREKEDALVIKGLVHMVGEELTVAPGPNYKKEHHVLGAVLPGNLNHVSLIGNAGFVPDETSLSAACQQVHQQKGICIVNHPGFRSGAGPRPMMWEEGLWESPKNRGDVDALEVYNGMAMGTLGVDFENRYLEATSYRGLGMHIAATASADTHGPESVKNILQRIGHLTELAQFFGVAASHSDHPRPELQAMTWLAAPTAELSAVIHALKQRKTIAVYALASMKLEFPQLGQVYKTDQVQLDVQFENPVTELLLYKNGVVWKRWYAETQVHVDDEVLENTAYVFVGRRGEGKFTTSAVWFEPSAGTRKK